MEVRSIAAKAQAGVTSGARDSAAFHSNEPAAVGVGMDTVRRAARIK